MVFTSISLADRKLTSATVHAHFWMRAVKLRCATSKSRGGGGERGDVWAMQAQRNGRWGWQCCRCWAVVDGVISASVAFQGLRLGQQITWRLWKSSVNTLPRENVARLDEMFKVLLLDEGQ